MVDEAPKPTMPWPLRIGMFALLIVVMVVALGAGFVCSRGLGLAGRDTQPVAPVDPRTAFVLRAILGVFSLAAGVGAYALTILTDCFTFEFRRPAWAKLRPRLVAANIIVPLPVMLGVGLLLSLPLGPFLLRAGLSQPMSVLAPILGVYVVLQLVFVWLDIWQPITVRFARKRLAALGIAPDVLRRGTPIGISNPARSSATKFGLIEEDVGVLWVEPGHVVYQGDTDQFSLAPGQLLKVERIVDRAAVSALFGAVHVVITLVGPDAVQRRIRLHTEGDWTLTAKARALDRLAERLSAWYGSQSAPNEADPGQPKPPR